MSKGKIDKNSNFFKNLENLYACKSGVKKPHENIKKHNPVDVPQMNKQEQQVPQQANVPQQINVPQQHVQQQMHFSQPVQVPQQQVPQNIIINVLGQPQAQNNNYVKCPNCDYIFCNNSQNPFLEFMK